MSCDAPALRSSHGGPNSDRSNCDPGPALPHRARGDDQWCAAPTPDSHAATPRSAPPPPQASDAGTTPAPSNHPQAPPNPAPRNGEANGARSDASPRTGPPPPSPARRPTPRAQPDSAAPRARAPPTRCGPPTADDINVISEEGSAPPSADPPVTRLPEPPSPDYRNRVPEVSPNYRSQRDKHLPGPHSRSGRRSVASTAALWQFGALTSTCVARSEGFEPPTF